MPVGVLPRLEARLAKLGPRLGDTVRHNWHLGFTAFGGPPVHFKILHDKFTDKLQWIDEEAYQELFSVTQALSGPASTKMLFCINLIHSGLPSAVLAFAIWSLPGAIGMYGLSLGVSNIDENLPRVAYALLSGVNAATVGIIAQAAVQLSEKAITDKMTRMLVFLGAVAGLMYNALWYFPLLMVLAALATVVHDFRWLHRPVRWVRALPRRLRGSALQRQEGDVELSNLETRGEDAAERHVERVTGTTHEDSSGSKGATLRPSKKIVTPLNQGDAGPSAPAEAGDPPSETDERTVPENRRLSMNWKLGLVTIAGFFLIFTAVMVLRGVLDAPPLLYRLFANMFLAGTIIFGGGPVVIPLLREYVVAEGWVSSRDFLIGLALIQAFPGPNFNFAVYLGGLTALNGGFDAAAGSVLGFVGIFLPGLVLVHGTMGIWSAIRGWRWVKSALRGINAAAVGLIYTAVYRLWQIGYIDEGYREGTSLAVVPWWVVVTATSYVGGMWFKVNAPVAIILGIIMGMIWYGVVST